MILKHPDKSNFTSDAKCDAKKHTLVSVINLCLVIEPSGKASLASFSDLQCHACDQSFFPSDVVFVTFLTYPLHKCTVCTQLST